MQVFIVLLVEFSIENVSFVYNQKMKARRPIFCCLLNFYVCLILYLTPYLVEVKMNDCQRGSNILLAAQIIRRDE